MAGRSSKAASGEVYFEFTQVGGQMRVAAIDPVTTTEVVVIAPLSAKRNHMQNLALAKLKRRLATTTEPEPRLF